ncbi:MAG: glycosyltransferase family 2 protein [Gammaproteobacteria bacterium]|nr:glycosyltransferase family 2 protein [Gammaproteobacteria bacterium]
MNKQPYISVIITTRNRPQVLELVLLALNEQTENNFEAIIADDGSDSETKELIKTLQLQLHFPLEHVWQPYSGFRVATIRNKAVAMAKGEYLIFLDGDCVVLTTFIQRHRRLAESGALVVGNRVLLSEKFTAYAIKQHLLLQRWSFLKWIKARWQRKCNRLLPLIYLPISLLRKLRKNIWQGAKTCNLAVWKSDFLKVNGFDESYTGWGYEDSDLVVRLFHSGVWRKDANFATPVIHFWHMQNDHNGERDNFKRLQTVLNSNLVKAQNGVDQYVK